MSIYLPFLCPGWHPWVAVSWLLLRSWWLLLLISCWLLLRSCWLLLWSCWLLWLLLLRSCRNGDASSTRCPAYSHRRNRGTRRHGLNDSGSSHGRNRRRAGITGRKGADRRHGGRCHWGAGHIRRWWWSYGDANSWRRRWWQKSGHWAGGVGAKGSGQGHRLGSWDGGRRGFGG